MRDSADLWEASGWNGICVARYRHAADWIERLLARVAELEVALRHIQLIVAGAPRQEDLFGSEPLYQSLDAIKAKVREALASGEEHKPAVVK
jgi:hypothetical protein